jgi:hypothetical protein
MRLTGNRAFELALALGILLLLLVTPTADTLAFGLHEHVVAPEHGSNLTEASNAQGSTSFHHCELSVTAGDLVSTAKLATPESLVIDRPELRASASSQRPFVPLTPPRA